MPLPMWLLTLNHEEAEMVADAPLGSLCSFFLKLFLSSVFKSPVNKASWSFFFSPDVSSCRYKKTQETFSQAGQKTSAAISTVSDVVARKLGDMR